MLQRMMRYLLVCVTASVFTAGGAMAEITPKYLAGVWTIVNQKNCGLKEFEHMVFRANGTFESRRFGVTDSTGF